MSHRLPPTQRPRVPTHHFPENAHQYRQNGESHHAYRNRDFCSSIAPYDTCDDTCDSNSYYDFNNPYTCKKEDCLFAGTDPPHYYECSETSRRFSRADFAKRSFRDGKFNGSAHKERKVYPSESATQRNATDALPAQSTLPLRVVMSRLSDRPQSSLSSGMASAMVDGCGGHCQTFENVCYYFLQVAFTMGILIGTSLSIAGAVLRKSAARNLQVLVYIGALLSMVSALLLAIQCSARYNARKRKKALRNAKRAPIPMDTLHTRPSVLQQQPLINQRIPPVQIVPTHVQPPRSVLSEQQGIPWWRRKDLN